MTVFVSKFDDLPEWHHHAVEMMMIMVQQIRNPLLSISESVLGNVVMNSCDVIPINSTCYHRCRNYL
jgi:hypothetical protein